MITLEQFSMMIPANKEPATWYKDAIPMFEEYGITTDLRIAGFMAQCAHESTDFTVLEENLNYSESALNRVFSRYFGPRKEDASEYARNPEKIANYVYMDKNRSKSGRLGNTESGDGWRFRGRGIKQLTGRTNYEKFGKTVGMSAEEAAEYVATPKGALESACWFWKTNKLEKFADKDDIVGLTKKINGGTIGLEDREKRYKDAKAILAGKCVKSEETRTLRKGMEGKDVKRMQKFLGVEADGVFGFGTLTALKKWQNKNGLLPDGIAGPATLAKMYG